MMAPEVFGIAAAIGFGSGAVLAVAAGVYGATHHVLLVRDELTGRAAQRAIEALRTGDVRMTMPQNGEAPDVQVGDLRIRRGTSLDEEDALAAPIEPDEAGTVLLDSGPDEAGTVLLNALDGTCVDSEQRTSVLTQGGE